MSEKFVFGIVESRLDPLKLGRCQVRIVGYHTHDKTQLKTEDLPWAIAQLPITSAGINGIGDSPTGPVEGTFVRIEFLDDDCQIPVMTGVLPGVPQAMSSIDNASTSMIFNSDDSSSSSEISSAINEPLPEATQSQDVSEALNETLNPAMRYAYISKDMEEFIKREEKFKANAYRDVDKWAIGWGSNYINGIPVTEGQTITLEQADIAFADHLKRETIPYIHRSCRSLLTQSMFDALCSLGYNIGGPKLASSSLMLELNSSRYLNAANRFGEWRMADGKINQTLVTRRSVEKNFFLKEGIPNDVGGMTAIETPSVDESPLVAARNQDLTTQGFQDPKGKYPSYTSESDTNRLSRGEEIEKTIVYKKETARIKNIPVAGSDATWSQPPNPYNAQYPHNQVRQTESGHLMEFDDTPGSERIQIYHRSGSFVEWDANGTKVNRIVGDSYEILERNGFIYINGNATCTINGNSNIKINSALNVDVSGHCNINVFNDANVNVSGSMNMSVLSDFNLQAKSINLESTGGNVNVKSANGTFIESATNTNMKSGGNFNADATYIHLNDGKSEDATGSNLSAPGPVQTPVDPTFPELTVITRSSNAAGFFETPEEGDATAYRKNLLDKGIITQEEYDYQGKEESANKVPENNVKLVPASCDILYSMDKFSPSLQLTPRINLGMLTKNGSRVPRAVRGISAQDVVCNLKTLSENCLDRIFEMYPSAIITSGLRIPGQTAGESSRSQHHLGQAADIIINGFSRREHYEAVLELQKVVPYDQLLLEFSGSKTVWIHISYNPNGLRKMAFTMNNHHRASSIGEYKLIV